MSNIITALLAESCIIYASVLIKITALDPILNGFYRVFLALPVFFVFGLKKGMFQVSAKDAGLMLLAGLLFGLDLVFFNTALHHTSVANVNLIGSMACFVLIPIGALVFKESLNMRFILGSVVAVLGLIVLIKGKADASVAHPFGDFLAFLSMCCYGSFLALVYGLRKRYATMVFMFYSGLSACTLLFVTAWMMEGIVLPAGFYTWSQVALVCIFGQILGQGFFGYIMGKISTQVSALIMLISPIIAALMGYVILGERLGIFEVLGIFIVLFGVYLARRN